MGERDSAELIRIAQRAAIDMNRACANKPTASVYLAIAYMMANMEASTKQPDRAGIFDLIGKAMDKHLVALRKR